MNIQFVFNKFHYIALTSLCLSFSNCSTVHTYTQKKKKKKQQQQQQQQQQHEAHVRMLVIYIHTLKCCISSQIYA